jgi:lipopolysaccharide transport system ATP-binding protein
MTNPAISIKGLSKQYCLGAQRTKGYRTLRESLGEALSSPWRRLRGLGQRREKADSFCALQDVSFDVQPGEVVGVIGRNGAGKSTFLKILSRITEPTSGRVELRGRVGSLLEVGTGFHHELTGRENIYLNGAILGMSRHEIDRKFDDIVEFSEVGKFLDTPVKRYSSGMFVRLAFGVASHLEPEILIVDEVLAVGDQAFRRNAWARWTRSAAVAARCCSSATTWRRS